MTGRTSTSFAGTNAKGKCKVLCAEAKNFKMALVSDPTPQSPGKADLAWFILPGLQGRPVSRAHQGPPGARVLQAVGNSWVWPRLCSSHHLAPENTPLISLPRGGVLAVSLGFPSPALALEKGKLSLREGKGFVYGSSANGPPAQLGQAEAGRQAARARR